MRRLQFEEFFCCIQGLSRPLGVKISPRPSQVQRRPPVMPIGTTIAMTEAGLNDVTKFLISAAKTSDDETASDAQ